MRRIVVVNLSGQLLPKSIVLLRLQRDEIGHQLAPFFTGKPAASSLSCVNDMQPKLTGVPPTLNES